MLASVRRDAAVPLLAFWSLLLLAASAAVSQEDPVAYAGANSDRGFSPDQLYQFDEIDYVNLFNGNATLTIPIGPSYPVSSSLSYQLVLSYNSNLWDFETRREEGEPFDLFVAHGRLLPGFNAGAGWSLSLGRLLRPREAGDDPPTNPGPSWVYVGPDGNHHGFLSTLHPGETVVPGVSYTRDGSYLRMTETAEHQRKIELPDGRILRFKDPLNDADPTTSAAEWLLWRIEDRFGDNWVEIGYSPADESWDTWSISDSHGRSHTVLFQPGPHPSHPRIVDRVELDAFGDTSPAAVWEFTAMTQSELARECPHNDPLVTTAEQNVPFLTEVKLPDLSTYAAPLTSYNTPTGTGCADASGRLRQLTLPTLGKIAWTYQPYFFPLPWEPFEPGIGEVGSAKSYGVATRSYLDRNDADLGTWIYTTSITPEPGLDSNGRELVNTVTDPLGHTTKHYFSVNRDPNDPAWPAYEYGLPFTRKSAEGDLFLSTEVFASGRATPERRTYLAFELDDYSEVGRGSVGVERNSRVKEQKVVFYDGNGARFEEATTVHSDFDGLGHYRTKTTGGDLPGENALVETTAYNRDPDRGTYEIDPVTNLPTADHDFTLVPSASPWRLNLFDKREMKEGVDPGADTDVQTFCFDEATGFLERRRSLKGTTELARDLVVEFTDDGDGNVASERYFGGDTQAVLSTNEDLCAFGLPGLEQYEIQHEYDFGTLRKSEYLKQDGTLFQELFAHTIDASTGLVASTTEPAGITTTFTYDALGRLEQELPTAGEGARVDYTYTLAGAGQAQVEIVRKQNPGGAELAREIIVFDDLGRVFEEKRCLPGGAFNLRQILYNKRGWKESVSEVTPNGGTPSDRTRFLGYDPFGRPATLRPPDGAAHDVSFTYEGESKVTRTVKIAGGEGELDATTTEIYDRHGRLHQVLEPVGPAGQTTTTYEFDAGNRLTRVSMSDGTTTQVRQFLYDGRGFLDSETHPEKGISGNGTVEYASYDARGHAGQKTDGSKVLVFTYDRAERLVEVRESGPAGPLLKELRYGSDADGRADGKLLSATRHNYLSDFGGVDVPIQEVFEYQGTSGRVSRRETRRAGVPWFETSFTWSDLGQIASITYPSCTIPTECTASGNPSGQPARTVAYGYDDGFLTTVDADPDIQVAVSYHPNEMLESIAFSNSDPLDPTAAATWWEQDPNAMRRPRRIHTTGVSGGAQFDTGVYAYDGAGNIESITTGAGTDRFTYDTGNRLVTGTTGAGQTSESSTYDGFGNRIQASTSSVGSRPIPVDPGTNRLLDSLRPVAYDDRGNLTRWGTATYTYDGLDQLTLLQDPGFADLSYLYTAANERIAIVNNPIPSETWYLRDLDGLVLRKFSRTGTDTTWQKDTIHRQGQVLATDGPTGAQHAHLDHLGTIRLWTDRAGGTPRHLTYSAFGEEISAAAAGRDHQFTGHERDRLLTSGSCLGTQVVNVDDETLSVGETIQACEEVTSTNTTVTSTEEVRFRAGTQIRLDDFAVEAQAVFAAENDAAAHSTLQDLDYMHARYYSPVAGRFLSTDPAGKGSSPDRPQSWNRYSYVLNSPLVLVDPDGRSPLSPATSLRLGLISRILLRRSNVQTKVVGPVVPGRGLGKLFPRFRGGVKGVEFFSLDLTETLDNKERISIAAQKAGLGVTASIGFEGILPVKIESLSLLGTVFQKNIFGEGEDQLTTGIGAIFGVEVSQDAAILSDALFLLSLDLNELVALDTDPEAELIPLIPLEESSR